MKNIAVITARGGSKRIPRKNIKNFLGKPMISYAIEVADRSALFQKILVSTDDLEIATVAKSFGAWVPFMRSRKNSDDFATTRDVLEEVISKLREKGEEFDNLCCIYPCVPLLTPDTLQDSYKKFTESGKFSLTPIVKFSYPIQRAFRLESDSTIQYVYPEFKDSRSQDLEEAYHDAGMFYWMKFDITGWSIEDKIGYEMSELEVQDIDNLSDWKLAELKYRLKNE